VLRLAATKLIKNPAISGAPMLLKFVTQVAARFGVVVTQKFAGTGALSFLF
jgi:hypothetical protein